MENKTSNYYEQVGDKLKGEDATRAYRQAQNQLDSSDENYMENAKRIQDKIIKSLS